MLETLNEHNYEEFLREQEWVAIGYSAVWCGSCQGMKENLRAVLGELGGKGWVVKGGVVDIDENLAVSERQKVRALPTVVIYHRGVEAGRRVGNLQIEELEKFFLEAKQKGGHE